MTKEQIQAALRERYLVDADEAAKLQAGNPANVDFFLNWGPEDGRVVDLGDLWHTGGPGGSIHSSGAADIAESATRLLRTVVFLHGVIDGLLGGER